MSIIQSTEYQVSINESRKPLKDILGTHMGQVLVLVDNNTARDCLPKMQNLLSEFPIVTIQAGESFKKLETCQEIWNAMLEHHLDRNSVLVNLGGGVIGDMGGFCASCYMRGIPFIQIPTTLLSQVDASVGGKLGIDYQGLKNMIGVFNNPVAVWIETDFLSTLPKRELVSGFAEVIKHALIYDSEMWNQLLSIQYLDDTIDWKSMVEMSVRIKNEVVSNDPFEGGLRKILNFGHTIGHAIESLSLETDNPLTHGEAIAIGMVCESYIANKKGLLPEEQLDSIKNYFLQFFELVDLSYLGQEQFLNYLLKDKKNLNQEIRMSLVGPIGRAHFDIIVDQEMVVSSLEYYMT